MMRINRFTGPALLALALGSTSSAWAAGWTDGMKEGAVTFKSAGPLAFGPDGILFVADTKGAAIVAIATGDTLEQAAARAAAAVEAMRAGMVVE